MISLCYFLIYLLNKGKIPGINIYEINENKNKFESFKNIKSKDYNYEIFFEKIEDF